MLSIEQYNYCCSAHMSQNKQLNLCLCVCVSPFTIFTVTRQAFFVFVFPFFSYLTQCESLAQVTWLFQTVVSKIKFNKMISMCNYSSFKMYVYKHTRSTMGCSKHFLQGQIVNIQGQRFSILAPLTSYRRQLLVEFSSISQFLPRRLHGIHLIQSGSKTNMSPDLVALGSEEQIWAWVDNHCFRIYSVFSVPTMNTVTDHM